MKIAHVAGNWFAEGMHVATFNANEVVDDRELLAYYSTHPGDKHYTSLRSPSRFDRYVLLRPDGTFLIVPMNPSIFIVVEA